MTNCYQRYNMNNKSITNNKCVGHHMYYFEVEKLQL